jgi:hypothetical protein
VLSMRIVTAVAGKTFARKIPGVGLFLAAMQARPLCCAPLYRRQER